MLLVYHELKPGKGNEGWAQYAGIILGIIGGLKHIENEFKLKT